MTDALDGWTGHRTSPQVSSLADWALVAGAQHDDGALLPLLLDIGGADIAAVVTALRQLPGGERTRLVETGNPFGPGGIYCVVAGRAVLTRLHQGQDAGLPHGLRVVGHSAPLPADAIGAPGPGTPPPLPDRPPARGVVITAVIDVGLPILNACFRTAGGRARVRHAWVQDGVAVPGGQVAYGREYDAAELEQAIAAHSTPRAGLDEPAAYRALGLMDFSRRHGHSLGRAFTHGAHVAALAAGCDPAENRTDRPVITVQLPASVVTDTSGSGMGPHLVAALDYITDRADRIAADMGCGRLPLVINFSFGGTGGPLDGTSPIERRMDGLIAARTETAPTAIVLPSGNAHLSGCHAKFEADTAFVPPDRTARLHWRIQPGDNTASHAEIWVPKGDPTERLSVALATPGGPQPGTWLGEDPGTAVTLSEGGTVVARLRYDFIGPPTNRGRFTVTVARTARQDSRPGTAPPGTWTLYLRNTALPSGSHVDAWILRDDEMPGFDNDARQSRFTDPRCAAHRHEVADDKPGCPIVKQGLQNVIATGRLPVVAGGYVARSGVAARYSAGGATNTPDRPGPDAMTVSDDSVAHPGVISAAVLSGGRVARGGTSSAAPQLARKLADLMADGSEADRAAVARLAKASEKHDFEHRAKKPPERRGGAGRIELAKPDGRRFWPE